MGLEVADMGVRTRAQVLAMAKRKNKCGDQPEIHTSTVVRLKRRRRNTKKNEGSTQLVMSQDSGDRCSGHVLEASCCYENCSPSEFEQESLGSLDLVHTVQGETVEEVETSTFDLYNTDRRETTNSSEPLDSSAVELECLPPNRSPVKEPPADDIEEFFAAAENVIQKRFTDKYNYDFAKDLPLEGRYEWVVIKP